MSLRLIWRDATRLPVDGGRLRPDGLADLAPAEAAAVRLPVGNGEVSLGDLFAVSGLDAPPGTLRIEGDLRGVARVGQGMGSGHLIVSGNLGSDVGSEMTGGRIDVYGNVGPWAAAEMRGGLIHVHGHAGDRLGSARPGSRLGMRDGIVLVDGDAGACVGQSMRRGLIAVGGAIGPAAGHAMIAGSLFVFGSAGMHPGLGMRRGTLLFGTGIDPALLLPTFVPSGHDRPPFLAVYLRELAALGFKPAGRRTPRLRRYNGDLSIGGQGEILVAVE
ncbi:MAG: formylmethanofuran dehydrogenase subunit C [Isosphaeraceae bacterium]|jgi:formylmethanofuran dehydrogenase subunit C|nr:MAG: formylmethanofuran dehydrogenase subunit C [Isosphaeraceae bacterium]